MRSGFAWIVAAVGSVLIAAAANSSAADFKYVGVKKCRTCHKKELIGDQYGKWQDAKHSKALETLKGEKAAEIAKEKGITGPASESEKCLKCHVTAFGADASAFDKKPLKAEDGVQCESCHGPGSAYKKKKTMADHDKSLAAGMWEPGKDEKICTACHNDESPTWDAAAGFDFEKRKEEIAHPIPEDVKGKYIEMEKKLKAEKGGSAEEEEE
jgi:nitrate/TMAO reductase-like tetraheme cytochrome c subunit